MGDDAGKKNRDFLKGFISKKALRRKEAQETNKDEKPVKRIKGWGEKKKKKKKSPPPMILPREFHKYQEKKGGSPGFLSWKTKKAIRKKALIETPMVKEFKEQQERKRNRRKKYYGKKRKR